MRNLMQGVVAQLNARATTLRDRLCKERGVGKNDEKSNRDAVEIVIEEEGMEKSDAVDGMTRLIQKRGEQVYTCGLREGTMLGDGLAFVTLEGEQDA